MKRILICAIILVFISLQAIGQNDKPKNSVFFELGGMAEIMSLNYDRSFYLSDPIGFNIGIGFSPLIIIGQGTLSVPIQVKFFYQFGKHSIEGGMGFTILGDAGSGIEFEIPLDVAIFAQVGYKYSIIRDRFYIGTAFTPFLGRIKTGYEFVPWGALRFGYKF
ncbi:MAG: hypothetical protein MUC78_01145 [Bacteroidales bacterium]|jgi:hypothetical protein|nr:hypothetical protein [Bacteroidales bacterium]